MEIIDGMHTFNPARKLGDEVARVPPSLHFAEAETEGTSSS